ncbi:bifunctional riboflavin kinase/FAD synthetase [candidate division KSB1 bacterium]|nr:bifunctional riboflavin kinase/FAD synthetase [candidate division KSB1 bacterium]
MTKLSLENLPHPHFDGTVVTIGNFDGVHIGHQTLIKTAVQEAHHRQLKSVVLTFHPHPTHYFRPEFAAIPINSRLYKEHLLEALNIDAMLTLMFNADLAQLSPEQYFQDILLDKLNARMICVGYDFTFGKNRKGNIRVLLELAEQHDVDIHILQPQKVEGHVVSSTRIREFLMAGQVFDAAQLLGRYHVLHGTVVHGDGQGTSMGFPTINIDDTEDFVPASGIYGGLAHIAGEPHPAAIYVGTKPTHGGKTRRIEAHLLNYSGNLYDQQATIAFLRFIRPDMKFPTERHLIKQIDNDCLQAQLDIETYLKNIDLPIIW